MDGATMIRLLISFLLSCSVAMAGQGMGPGPGVKGYATGGGANNIAFRSIVQGDTIAESPARITTNASLVVSAEDLIVCYVAGTNTVSGVTCGANNLSLAKRVSISDPYYYEAWYGANSSENTGTCTATFSGSANYRNIYCVSYDGVATTAPLDQSSCNSAGCNAIAATSTSLTAQNVTTTTSNQVLIGSVLRWNNVAAYTQGANYVERGIDSSVHGHFDSNVTYAGTYPNQAFGTTADTDQYISIYLTFKAQ